jgi:hypothetical protein
MERSAARLAPRYGWRVIDQLSPAGYPVYALRLTDGGAVVIYATSEKYGWRAISSAATLTAPRSATGIGAAPDAFTLHQLHITSVSAGLRITFTIIDEHIAIDPAGSGTVTDYLNGKTVTISKS